MLFPPPACAVILVVSPVAHGGPHASAAHRAVATTLGMAVGAFHGQFHSVVLVIQVRTRQWVGGCRGNGWGRHVVDGFQGHSSFNTCLSARNRSNPKGRRRDSEPGLGTKQKHPHVQVEAPSPSTTAKATAATQAQQSSCVLL